MEGLELKLNRHDFPNELKLTHFFLRLWDADMYFVLEPWEDRKIHSPDVTKAVGKDVQATAGSLVFGQTQAALEETECLLGKPPQDMGDRAQ